MKEPTIMDCIQGDPQWMQYRLGCVTSSRVAAAVAVLTRKSGDKKAGEPTKARENLLYELAGEINTGKLSEHYVSTWMEEGKQKEPLAKAAYDYAMGIESVQIGFAYHPTIKMAGCSPDAIVGPDGGAEFKCPKVETHLRYLVAEVIPKEYLPQMHWQIACMGWEWNDFVTHHPDFKKSSHRTMIIRLHRDETIIRDMEEKVVRFNEEVQEIILKLDPGYIAEKLAASVKKVQEDKENAGLYIVEEDYA